MAISGGVLLLFVVGHLVGNLQVFLGPEALNRYGQLLHSVPEVLWIVRLSLITMVGLHIWSAIRLSAENKAARPDAYANAPAPLAASYASRTMLMSGLIIAAFVIYHLLHFTVQAEVVNLAQQDFKALVDAQGRPDVYRMLIIGFSKPLVSGFYVLAMGLLCLHLSHGAHAMFQSLGWTFGCCPDLPKCLARGAAILIFLGFASIPIAVLLGFGKEALK